MPTPPDFIENYQSVEGPDPVTSGQYDGVAQPLFEQVPVFPGQHGASSPPFQLTDPTVMPGPDTPDYVRPTGIVVAFNLPSLASLSGTLETAASTVSSVDVNSRLGLDSATPDSDSSAAGAAVSAAMETAISLLSRRGNGFSDLVESARQMYLAQEEANANNIQSAGK